MCGNRTQRLLRSGSFAATLMALSLHESDAMIVPFRRAGLLALAALASLPALADSAAPRYNQVSLRAEVSREVPHDLMQVNLYSEVQHTDASQLAGETTRRLNAAVERARKAQGVKISLGSRNSYPVYDKDGSRIVAWRERANLHLESTDFSALSQLTADLLGDLKMGGMEFAVADATRRKHEDELLREAVAAFKARAQLATEALGAHGYRLVNLDLNGSGMHPPIPMRAAAMKSMGQLEAAQPQEIEAGTSQVGINAEGVIEVQMP